MKCLNCGARVKKSEEICSECGAYVSKDTRPAILPVQNKEKKEISVELLENAMKNTEKGNEPDSCRFNFGDHIVFPSIIRLGGGIVIILAMIFSASTRRFMYMRASAIHSLIFCVLFSLFLFFKGIASIIQERKCALDVTPEKLSGTIPLGFFDTETIDINIGDIIAVKEKQSHSKQPSGELHIVTKEKEYVIRSSSQSMLLELSEILQNNIRNLKGET